MPIDMNTGDGERIAARLTELADLPIWCCWREELRNNKRTKVPFSPHGGHARANDPSTFGTREQAERQLREIRRGHQGKAGLGIMLGDLSSMPGVGAHINDARQFARMWERTTATAPLGLLGALGDADFPAPSLALLSEQRRPAPEFPLHVLGDWWRQRVEEAADGACAPVDYVVAGLFAAASALIGNARWVRVAFDWKEPPFLWLCAVGNPSNNKSPGLNSVLGAPLERIEQSNAPRFAEALRDWETKAEVAKRAREAWERGVKDAHEAGETPPEMPPEAVAPAAPAQPRIVVKDATMEKLAALAAGNPKGLLLSRDELAAWLNSFGRYTSGGGLADRATWLEIWSAKSHMQDRVKNPQPIYVRRFGLSVVGTIQPDRLRSLTAGDDDGMPARFLWFWPDRLLAAERPKRGADARAIETALARLAGLAMGEDDQGEPEPVFVPLSDEAGKLMDGLMRSMQDREAREAGPMLGAVGKMRGQAARLALVIEHLWWCGAPQKIGFPPPPSKVSAEAMHAACSLVQDYFLPMARRVFGDAGLSPAERGARTLLKHIIATGAGMVNQRAIRETAGLPGLSEAKAVEAAFAALVEDDILFPAAPAGGPGRPRRDYRVNPKLHEAVTKA